MIKVNLQQKVKLRKTHDRVIQYVGHFMMNQSFIDHAAAVDWIENELCNLNITISLTSKYHSHLLCLMDRRGSVGPLYSGSTGVEWRIVPVGRSCAIYQAKHVTMMSLLNLTIASSRGGRLAQHF
jgi:hypothetical protein